MCLSALSDGGGYTDDDRDCGALASDSCRLSILPASVCDSDDLGVEAEEMTIDVFWQRIESAIYDFGECAVCPVNEYAKETNTERMCDKVCDCADGLMMLHRTLQELERQKKERDEDGRG